MDWKLLYAKKIKNEFFVKEEIINHFDTLIEKMNAVFTEKLISRAGDELIFPDCKIHLFYAEDGVTFQRLRNGNTDEVKVFFEDFQYEATKINKVYNQFGYMEIEDIIKRLLIEPN